MLRALCERTLQFENYFLTVYKDYLLAELRSDNAGAQKRALWVLGHIVYDDADVRRAVHVLAGARDEAVQQAATQVLALFQQP
jgi:hypothetical protein